MRPVIQDASDAADHAHSGCVVIVTVAVAPLAATGSAGAASVTAHFVGEGPVDVATVEPHPAPHIAHAATKAIDVAEEGSFLRIFSAQRLNSKISDGVVPRRQTKRKKERAPTQRGGRATAVPRKIFGILIS